MDRRLRLVLLSFLMLFVELALIRWTGSNVVYLSYFSNFVLLGSFLGIGLGLPARRGEVRLLPRTRPSSWRSSSRSSSSFRSRSTAAASDLIYFGNLSPSGLPPWLALPIIFVAVAAVMA